MIDTHTHLYHARFAEDRQEMLQRARQAGVKRFYLPSIDKASFPALISLAENEPDCFAMSGLHPSSVQEHFAEELEYMLQELQRRPDFFCAIGEIGIDLYWDRSTLAWQQEAFARQIELALSLNKPIVIHCRDAFDEVFEVLEGYRERGLSGILHCFSGGLPQAQRALDFNLKLGIGGIITFKNGGLGPVVAEVPLEELLLETDAPFLAPAPFRGKRNEPAYLPRIAEKLAEVKNTRREEVVAITSQTALKLFGHDR